MTRRPEYRSPLSSRYATAPMVANFADQRRVLLWRRLWVELARAQRDLGLPISTAQIEAMEANLERIDFDRVSEIEAKTRHDVMAHVKHFGELVGGDAEKIIHLGATSCFVADNADLVMMRDGVGLLIDRVVAVLENLRAFAVEHRSTPTLAYTHFQPAQLTTVGKRACLWAQDLALDLESLSAVRDRIPFRGAKGTTGTQASYLALFDGDHDKVRKLDERLGRAMGFRQTIPVTGQTYTRKVDTWVVHALADVSSSAAKFATDLRLLSHKREVEEPFGTEQVGSSAMAYKRNPMRSERICSLARFVHSLASSPPATHSNQWFERTLDDSANRRLVIAESFLATDGVLNLAADVTSGLIVNEAVIRANLQDDLPFMATENVIMAGATAGKSRQELHERVRRLSLESARVMKEKGVRNDLVERMRADAVLSPHVTDELLDPAAYVGRSVEQVEEFVAEVLDPLLGRFADRRGRFRSRVEV